MYNEQLRVLYRNEGNCSGARNKNKHKFCQKYFICSQKLLE